MTVQSANATLALASYENALTVGPDAPWRKVAINLAVELRAELLRTTANTNATPRTPRVVGPRAFEMTAESLTKALKIVTRAVGRSTIPIMNHVLLVASGDHLVLTGSDLDREIAVRVNAPCIGSWAATTEAKLLAKVLASARGWVVMTPCDEGGIELSGALDMKLPGLPHGDFPMMVWPEKSTEVNLPPAAWLDMLSFVQPCISTEATRYYLNGAYIHSTHEDGCDWITSVATDGSRMNVIRAPLPERLKPWALAGYIVPIATVKDLISILPGCSDIKVDFSPHKLLAIAGPITMVSKLIDGAFPDYCRVIPDPTNGEVATFDRADLDAALLRVSTITAGQKNAAVRMTYTKGGCELKVRNFDGVKANAHVACRFDGETREVSFNIAFLRQALACLTGRTATLRLNGANDPLRIYDDNKSDRFGILMPLRT